MTAEVDELRCAAAVSAHPDPAVAIGEVLGSVLERLEPHPQAAVLLVSNGLAGRLTDMVAAVRTLLAPEILIGSTVDAVFDSRGQPVAGVAIWVLDGCSPAAIRPLRLTMDDGSLNADGFESDGLALLFADASFPIEQIPVPGRASDGDGPGGSSVAGSPVVVVRPARRNQDGRFALIEGGQQHTTGAVGLRMTPAVAELLGIDVRIWEDDDPIPEPPVVLDRARGAILIAEPRVDLSAEASLDLEVMYEELGGSLIGMVGRPDIVDRPARPDPASARPNGVGSTGGWPERCNVFGVVYLHRPRPGIG